MPLILVGLYRESVACKGIWHIDEAQNNKQDSTGVWLPIHQRL